MKKSSSWLPRVVGSLGCLLLLVGCATQSGNLRPDQKESPFLDLAQFDSDWIRLDAPPDAAEAIPGSAGATAAQDKAFEDISFQSKTTAAVISLHSACRGAFIKKGKSLRDFTRALHNGITEIKDKNERERSLVSQDPSIKTKVDALETTITGKENGEEIQIRTVAFKKGSCLYDLSYVSRPAHFAKQEQIFEKCVTSLKMR